MPKAKPNHHLIRHIETLHKLRRDSALAEAIDELIAMHQAEQPTTKPSWLTHIKQRIARCSYRPNRRTAGHRLDVKG